MCISFQTKKDQEDEEMDIATCMRGQYFGELALVTNKPRAASAYAVGSVKCLGMICGFLMIIHVLRLEYKLVSVPFTISHYSP